MPRKEPRNYQEEYKDWHGKPKQRKARSNRVLARRKVEKEQGDLPKSMEVDHKKALTKGGTNAKSNLRVVPKAVNRKKGNRPS